MANSVLPLAPVATNTVLKDRVYDALKTAILSMGVYQSEADSRLDERTLADELGVSRTPVREAITRLEQEGLVKIIPRRGAFVVRKTKKEVVEIIYVWAALESMAARMAIQSASDEDIAQLRKLFVTFTESHQAKAQIDEYSERNIDFHQTLISLSGCSLLSDTAAGLFLHMRMIRHVTIKDGDRSERSIVDHLSIIEAIEARDIELAERLVREHTLTLAEHIKNNVSYLE